eukprot:GEMP01009180.1.p1 GENE.GEMP01009180.1~~GEMP01009180.1.p1  ORF type:complete len:826 (+),score=196.95 GEMP01009180.1:109-2586(+)
MNTGTQQHNQPVGEPLQKSAFLKDVDGRLEEAPACKAQTATFLQEAEAMVSTEPEVALEVAWQLVNAKDPELKEQGMAIIEMWREADKNNGWMVSHEFVRVYHEVCVMWLQKNELTKAQACIDMAFKHYSQGTLDPSNELAFDLQAAQCEITPTVEILRKVDKLAGEEHHRVMRLLALAYRVCEKVSIVEQIQALEVAERSNSMAVRISLTFKFLEVGRVDEALVKVEAIVRDVPSDSDAFSRVAKLHAHVLLHAPMADPQSAQLAVRRFINLPNAPAADCLDIIKQTAERDRPFAVECLRSLYISLPQQSKEAAYALELFLLSQEVQSEAQAADACRQVMDLLNQLENIQATLPRYLREYVARTLWYFASLFINNWLPNRREETIVLLKRIYHWSLRDQENSSDRKTCRILCVLLMDIDVVEAKKYSYLGLSLQTDKEDDLSVIDLMLDLQMSTDVDVCLQKIETLSRQSLRMVLPKAARYPVAKKRVLELLWDKGEKTLDCIRSILNLDNGRATLGFTDTYCQSLLQNACLTAQQHTGPIDASSTILAGSYQDHLRWIKEYAWNKGMPYIHEKMGPNLKGIPFLDKCLRLTKMLPQNDENMVDMRTLVTAIQMALINKRQHTGYEEAFKWVSECTQHRNACEKKGIHGNETSYIVEFEIRLHLQDPEIIPFLKKVASSPSLTIGSFLRMARLAADDTQREIARQLIDVYIRNYNAHSFGKVNYGALGPAYRALVTLQNPAESFAQISYLKNLIDNNTPEKEVSWLVATAWNVGAAHFKRLNMDDAEKWMALAIDLVPYCELRDKLDDMAALLAKCRMQDIAAN